MLLRYCSVYYSCKEFVFFVQYGFLYSRNPSSFRTPETSIWWLPRIPIGQQWSKTPEDPKTLSVHPWRKASCIIVIKCYSLILTPKVNNCIFENYIMHDIIGTWIRNYERLSKCKQCHSSHYSFGKYNYLS